MQVVCYWRGVLPGYFNQAQLKRDLFIYTIIHDWRPEGLLLWFMGRFFLSRSLRKVYSGVAGIVILQLHSCGIYII